jgi:hypothetical protein
MVGTPVLDWLSTENDRSIVPRSIKAQDEVGIEEKENLHFVELTYAKQQSAQDSGIAIRLKHSAYLPRYS